MYWDRSKIDWKSPNLTGKTKNPDIINFNDQIGVYLLHDHKETIYVGRSIKDSIIERLKTHTTDRFAGRWQKFSWFGLRPTDKNGRIIKIKNKKIHLNENIISLSKLIIYLEAILIEGLEPRQNRKKGDNFNGIEFIQT